MERVAYLVHLLRSGRRHMVLLLPGQWTDCNADYSHCCCGLSALEMQNYQQQCHQNSLSLPYTAKKPGPFNKILRKHSNPGHVRNHRLSLTTAKLDKSCKSSRGSLITTTTAKAILPKNDQAMLFCINFLNKQPIHTTISPTDPSPMTLTK